MSIKFFITLTLVSGSCLLFAQNESPESVEHSAPSLQLGLDGISFTKGDLDAQLIIEMVAEKQKEIKIKLVENMLLSKLYQKGTSGMVYNYTSNVLNSFLTEPNPEIRTKTVLENTVNAVFAYSFADHIYRNSKKITTSPVGNKIDDKIGYNLTKIISTLELPDNTRKRLASGVIDNDYFGRYERNGELLESYKSKEPGESKKTSKTIDGRSEYFVALMIDLCSEVLRNNEKLNSLGISRISYSDTYSYINKYLELKKKDEYKIRTFAEALYESVDSRLNNFLSATGTITFLFSQKDLHNKLIKSSAFGVFQDGKIALSDVNYFRDLENNIKSTLTSMQDDAKIKVEIAALSEKLSLITSYIDGLKRALASCNSDPKCLSKALDYLDNVVSTIDREIIPTLKKSVIYNTNLTVDINKISSFNKALALQIKEANSVFDDIYNSPFFTVLSKVYDFDQTATYVDYINLLPDLENAFKDQKIKYGLSHINSFVSDYTSTKKNEEGRSYMEVNIEGFLQRMQQIKPDKIRKAEFMFTVGVNNAVFLDGGLKMGEDTIVNYSFVSEKIGLKIKIRNWEWKSRQPGETYSIGRKSYIKTAAPKEPVVSNLHWLFYGSGVLYNLVNTGTTKDFNSPLVGTGFGLSFYNSLDLNVTVGLPLATDGSTTPFWGFGFEIPFIEYIDRANKNRKANKSQKLLAEKSNNN